MIKMQIFCRSRPLAYRAMAATMRIGEYWPSICVQYSFQNYLFWKIARTHKFHLAFSLILAIYVSGGLLIPKISAHEMGVLSSRR